MKQLILCLNLIISFTVSAQIKIDDVGDGWKQNIQHALTVIQSTDSAKYQQIIKVCNHIGFWNGSYSTTEGSVILISNREAAAGITNDLAAAIVHESMHIYIANSGIVLSATEEETFCYIYELDFLLKLSFVQPWLIQHVLQQLDSLAK
jgi:hypothetical protein